MRNNEGGFTLIETIVGLVVMTLMVTAVSQLFVSNLANAMLGKARAIGLELAQEQMEYLRDLPYDSLRTQNGTIYPPGTLPDTQSIVRGGYRFVVATQISYVDDPYDGNAAGTIPGKPKDLNPADYKRVQIAVSLQTGGQKVAQLTSDFAAKAAETASNTGILSIQVINASGNPVPSANVTITNTAQSPAVNISTTTDNNGYVTIPNLPPDSNNEYQVAATLPGYSTDTTIPAPSGTQTAVELNPNVLVQQVTSVTMTIDRTSTLSISVVDTSGNPIANKAITVTGAKETMLNPIAYKYAQASTTDSGGDISLTGMEWDSYSYAPPAGYYLVSSQPYAPTALSPNSALSVKLVLSTNSNYPAISAVSPTSGQTGTSTVSLTLTGSNLPSSTSVTLLQAGQPTITASGCASSGSNPTMILTCNLSLTGAASGTWDIAATTGVGTVTQTGGFSVTP